MLGGSEAAFCKKKISLLVLFIFFLLFSEPARQKRLLWRVWHRFLKVPRFVQILAAFLLAILQVLVGQWCYRSDLERSK